MKAAQYGSRAPRLGAIAIAGLLAVPAWHSPAAAQSAGSDYQATKRTVKVMCDAYSRADNANVLAVAKTQLRAITSDNSTRISTLADEIVTLDGQIKQYSFFVEGEGTLGQNPRLKALQGEIKLYREKLKYWEAQEPKTNEEHMAKSMGLTTYRLKISEMQEQLADIRAAIAEKSGIDPNTAKGKLAEFRRTRELKEAELNLMKKDRGKLSMIERQVGDCINKRLVELKDEAAGGQKGDAELAALYAKEATLKHALAQHNRTKPHVRQRGGNWNTFGAEMAALDRWAREYQTLSVQLAAVRQKIKQLQGR